MDQTLSTAVSAVFPPANPWNGLFFCRWNSQVDFSKKQPWDQKSAVIICFKTPSLHAHKLRGWDGKSANRGQLPTCCTIWRANRRFLQIILANLCNKMQRCKFYHAKLERKSHMQIYLTSKSTMELQTYSNMWIKHANRSFKLHMSLSSYRTSSCWTSAGDAAGVFFHRKNSGEWNVKFASVSTLPCMCSNSTESCCSEDFFFRKKFESNHAKHMTFDQNISCKS